MIVRVVVDDGNGTVVDVNTELPTPGNPRYVAATAENVLTQLAARVRAMLVASHGDIPERH